MSSQKKLQEEVIASIPFVIENTPKGERQYDIYSRLLMDRIVFLGTQVNDQVANAIIAQFLFLESVNPEKEISLYINSPGGSVTAGLGIYDVMQYITCPVSTMCTGMAASMGSLLLCGGAKGKRYALPNAQIMIHQPLGGAQGQASDIEIAAKNIIRMKRLLNGIYEKHTGQDLETLERDTDRDNYMTSEQAKEYGLIDEIIAHRQG